MTRISLAATLLATAAAPALAGGLDRTGLPIDILFEEGNTVRIGAARTLPAISGSGTGVPAAATLAPFLSPDTEYDDVGGAFTTFTGGVKLDVGARLSAAVIFDQPFGADVEYAGDPDATELGGTRAVARSDMLSALLRYRIDETWSVHGGLRIDRGSGEIDLRGLAYGAPSFAPTPPGAPVFAAGVNGYSVELDPRTDIGWTVGAAYEIPDIALRVVLTYNSEIAKDFDTTESFRGTEIGTSTTEVILPQSVNLDVQTGIAEDTLVFGALRWAEWSTFRIDPELFTAAVPAGLVDLDDSWTWTLGAGRRFSDRFAARAAITYEPGGDDDLVSPLTPTNGLIALGLGGAYDVTEAVTLSGGLRYAWLGDAQAETGTPDTARAEMTDNSAVSLAFGLAYRF